MADNLSTYEGRQAARDAGNYVGQNDDGSFYAEPGHPGGEANAGVGAGGGGGGGGGSSGSGDLSGYVAAMQASSGFSIKQLEEQKREFDQTLEWQKQQWREQGLPELAIKQRAQDLEEAKFGELQRAALVSETLQTRAQDLQEKVQTGQLDIAKAKQQLDEIVQKGQLGVSQGQLGLDTLKTAASLSGPENWIQASNFARGVQGNPNLQGFVGQLLSGQSTATLGGPQAGMQMSAPLSMGGMAAGMGVPQQPAFAVQPGQGGVTPLPQVGPNAGQPMTPEQMQAAMMQRQQQMQQQVAGQQAFYPGAAGQQPVQQPLGGAGAPADNWADIQARYQAYQQQMQGQQAAMQQANPAASATAAPAGFYTTIANGQQVYTPTTGQGGAAAAPQAQQAASPQWATQDDVAKMFGRPTGQTAQASGWGGDTSQAQNSMYKLFQQGGQALGPQALEGLTSTERKMMEGGGAAMGADVAGFEEQYQRSRIGQQSAKPKTFSGM